MLLFCLCKDPPPLEPSERLEEAAAPEFQAEPETIPAPDVEGVEEADTTRVPSPPGSVPQEEEEEMAVAASPPPPPQEEEPAASSPPPVEEQEEEAAEPPVAEAQEDQAEDPPHQPEESAPPDASGEEAAE